MSLASFNVVFPYSSVLTCHFDIYLVDGLLTCVNPSTYEKGIFLLRNKACLKRAFISSSALFLNLFKFLIKMSFLQGQIEQYCYSSNRNIVILL